MVKIRKRLSHIPDRATKHKASTEWISVLLAEPSSIRETCVTPHPLQAASLSSAPLGESEVGGGATLAEEPTALTVIKNIA